MTSHTQTPVRSYGFAATIDLPYDQALERTRAALKGLAHRAQSADLGIGLLLPCNVVVYDNGDNTSTVEVMDPEAALGLVGDNPVVADVAHEASARLHQALDALVAA
jgi:hypothetical protein